MTEELWVSPSDTSSNGWHLVTAVPGDEGQTTVCGLPVEVDAGVYSRFPRHAAACAECRAARETAVKYSIVSTAGLHYQHCGSVWEAFKLVRKYPTRFLVQREVDGIMTWYDRSGYELGIARTEMIKQALSA